MWYAIIKWVSHYWEKGLLHEDFFAQFGNVIIKHLADHSHELEE